MNRDQKLERQILGYIAVNQAPGQPVRLVEIDGYDEATISAHIEIMIADALIDGQVIHPLSGGAPYVVHGITPRGYALLRG